MKFKFNHNRMFKRIVIAMGLVLAAQSAIAGDHAKLVGVWKVISFETEFKDGSPSRHVYGAHPKGYVIYTAEGRVMSVIEAEGRKAGKTDQEHAALHRSMVGVTGTYRLEGDNKYIAKIDVSWNPALNGTEQVRFYKVDGDRLEVTTGWAPSPILPGAPVARGLFLFERAK